MQATPLHGAEVTLRLATEADVPALVEIRRTPEVHRWWRGDLTDPAGLADSIITDMHDPAEHHLVIEHQGRIVGSIQWYAEDDPDYRHAGIDIYLDPSVRGRGLGADAIHTLARHLFDEYGHHRIVIDPAAENTAAIRCYTKVGFRPVGVMRQYERGADGSWHDGVLMDLLAGELEPQSQR
jgi:aminoglycoside 6'-N-acetyltransferase